MHHHRQSLRMPSSFRVAWTEHPAIRTARSRDLALAAILHVVVQIPRDADASARTRRDHRQRHQLVTGLGRGRLSMRPTRLSAHSRHAHQHVGAGRLRHVAQAAPDHYDDAAPAVRTVDRQRVTIVVSFARRCARCALEVKPVERLRRARAGPADRRAWSGRRAAHSAVEDGFINSMRSSPCCKARYRGRRRRGQITDIALQPGELVGAGPVAAGAATSRWIIGDTSGSGALRMNPGEADCAGQ